MDRTKNIGMGCLRYAVVLAVTSLGQGVFAETDDFGMWVSAEAEMRIDKKWDIGISGEFRSRDNSGEVDRWAFGVDGEYKIVKWLRASAGYTLLYDNNREKTTYYTDGSSKHWRPSYWGVRHRFSMSLTGRTKAGRFTFTLRERWQYTYRPEKNTKRYDFSESSWEEKTVRGKGRNVLRSRLRASYDTPHCGIDPYVSAEFFNAWSLYKTRYTLGVEYNVTKKHALGIAYIFQDVENDDDDNDTDSHIISVSYKFKF